MKQLVVIGLGLCLFSCTDEQAVKQALIQQEVDAKLDKYKSERIRVCREKIMHDVIAAADSVMLRNAYFDIPDTLKVPVKKQRPNQPNTPFPKYEKPKPVIDSLEED